MRAASSWHVTRWVRGLLPTWKHLVTAQNCTVTKRVGPRQLEMSFYFPYRVLGKQCSRTTKLPAQPKASMVSKGYSQMRMWLHNNERAICFFQSSISCIDHSQLQHWICPLLRQTPSTNWVYTVDVDKHSVDNHELERCRPKLYWFITKNLIKSSCSKDTFVFQLLDSKQLNMLQQTVHYGGQNMRILIETGWSPRLIEALPPVIGHPRNE